MPSVLAERGDPILPCRGAYRAEADRHCSTFTFNARNLYRKRGLTPELSANTYLRQERCKGGRPQKTKHSRPNLDRPFHLLDNNSRLWRFSLDVKVGSRFMTGARWIWFYSLFRRDRYSRARDYRRPSSDWWPVRGKPCLPMAKTFPLPVREDTSDATVTALRLPPPASIAVCLSVYSPTQHLAA